MITSSLALTTFGQTQTLSGARSRYTGSKKLSPTPMESSSFLWRFGGMSGYLKPTSSASPQKLKKYMNRMT